MLRSSTPIPPALLLNFVVRPLESASLEAATWDSCRADFAFDGALVDLLAPVTGPAEWETFWSALRSSPFELRAFRDDEPITLPESVSWVFAEREVASVMVSVVSGSITANCHFFGGDLELDIDPREVTSEAAFESVLAVMRFVAAVVRLPVFAVAAVVRLPVFAVAEGGTSAFAFLRVSPDGQAVFLQAGSVR